MGKKIAVLGTGAIGSSVGADLTKAGYDVVLMDQWPAHVETMKSVFRTDAFFFPLRAAFCTVFTPIVLGS